MSKNKGFAGLVYFVTILAVVSLSCGVSSLPNPFATQTPTPTLTLTPTATFTPSPTPTTTQTPSPTATPRPTGMETQKQPDGSTLLIDHDNQYQLVLPKDWVIIPINRADLASKIAELEKENPKLRNALDAFKNLDPKIFRAVIIYANEQVVSKDYATNINISVFDNETLNAVPLSFITAVLEDSFQKNGAKILTKGVNEVDNAHNVEVEYMDYEQILKSAGSTIVVRSRVLVFQANNKLVVVQLATPKQFEKLVFPIANSIGGTIELIK